jgi:hypothetical protein
MSSALTFVVGDHAISGAYTGRGDGLVANSVPRTAVATGAAGYVVYNGVATGTAPGYLAEEQYLSRTRGGIEANVSTWTGIVKATTTGWSASLVVNADVNNTAAIDRSKIATGAAGYVVYNKVATDPNPGYFTEEQYLAKMRGGLGANVTGLEGIVRAKSGAAVPWETTLINVSDFTSGFVLPASYLVTQPSNYVAIYTNNSQLAAEQYLSRTRGGIETNVSTWNGLVRAGSATGWTASAQIVSNADIVNLAGITRSKIAAGTTSFVVYNDTSTGLLAEEQYLSKARGGLGQSMVMFGGTSGALVRAFASTATDTVGIWQTALVGTNDLVPGFVLPITNLPTFSASYAAFINASSQLAAEQFLSFHRGGLGQQITATSAESRIAGIAAGASTSTSLVPATIWNVSAANLASSIALRDTNAFVVSNGTVKNSPSTSAALTLPAYTTSNVYDVQSVIRTNNSVLTNINLLTINFPTTSATSICWCGSIDVMVNVGSAASTAAPTSTVLSSTGFFHLVQRFNRYVSSGGAPFVTTYPPAVKLVDMDTSLNCDISLGSTGTSAVTLFCKPSTTNWLSWQAVARVYQRAVVAVTGTDY